MLQTNKEKKRVTGSEIFLAGKLSYGQKQKLQFFSGLFQL